MGTFLYLACLLLVITWAVASLVYNANGLIHLLLLAALAIGLLRINLYRKSLPNNLKRS
jgi:hypothetical protein